MAISRNTTIQQSKRKPLVRRRLSSARLPARRAETHFNTYAAAGLERRSALATHLKYGPGAAALVASTTGATVKDISFPKGLAPAPAPIHPAPDPNDSLPHVDVIAMMDTAAEARAMAGVLTPGIQDTDWYHYAKNFQKQFLPLIGPHGPSRMSRRLGSYFVTEINKLKVLVYKTELHMHEDALQLKDGSYSLPIKDMLAQMIADAKPRVFLTTGTSGGVYCSMHLGDVVVSRAARFNCMKDFETAPFNHKTFQSNWTIPVSHMVDAQKLMRNYATHLTGRYEPKGAPPNPKCGCSPEAYPAQIHFDGKEGIPAFHPILTTDIFEFGTTMNNLDRLGMAVEMDDACLGLACSEMNAPPHWACVRNLSDPTINGQLDQKLQESCAEYYYTKFGYWTTVMSALATWAIVAGLGETS
jgi:nucleoside phosphorylase